MAGCQIADPLYVVCAIRLRGRGSEGMDTKAGALVSVFAGHQCRANSGNGMCCGYMVGRLGNLLQAERIHSTPSCPAQGLGPGYFIHCRYLSLPSLPCHAAAASSLSSSLPYSVLPPIFWLASSPGWGHYRNQCLSNGRSYNGEILWPGHSTLSITIITTFLSALGSLQLLLAK